MKTTTPRPVLLAFVAAVFLSLSPLRAQTLNDAYLFSTWLDTNAWIALDSNAFTLMAPSPVATSIRSSGRSSMTNIGFPFTLAGVEHTKFSVNVYGTFRLGNTQVSASNNGVTPLYVSGTNIPKVEPFGGQMCMDSSSRITSAVIGDSGNRVLVVEMRLSTYNTPRARLSAQIQLFEATGEVRLVYGPMSGDTLPMAMQNGIAASSNDVAFIDMVSNNALFSEGGVSQTNPVGMWPDEGRVYSFMLNPDYCPRPGAVSMTSSNPDSLTLVWSGSGSQYRLHIPDADIDTLVSDTTIALSGLYDTTTYSGTLQAVCPSDTSRPVAFSFTTAVNPAHTPLFSCNFEAADAMDVWENRRVAAGGGSWERRSDNSRPVGKRWVARCFPLYHRTDTWLVTPNITLPADASGYYLRWKQKLTGEDYLLPTFKVRLATATDTIADDAPTSAYSTELYSKTARTSGYESQQVSLAQYGGQTIRLAFSYCDNCGWGTIAIDDVDVVPTFRPEIQFSAPDSVEVGDTLQLVATVRQGYTRGMTVEWHSAMEARGEASLVYDSLQATIVYNTVGIDTITVTAYSQHGTRTVSSVVRVPDPLRFVVPHTTLASDATFAFAAYDTIGFKVMLTSGSTNGLQHTWWSAMASRGEAMLHTTASDDSVYLVYLTPGQDTVVVHTANTYGTTSDTAVVRVCTKHDTLPYVADFASEFSCWQVLEGTCSIHSSGYLSFEDWPTTVVSPPVWIPTDGNVVLDYGCAYSFFYGSTMVMVTTDMVHFDTIGNKPFITGTHPNTLIPLGAYAGQYVRVVFKATGQFLQYYLANVHIRYANEPVVQLEADDGHFPGTPVTLTASLREGHPANVAYRWSSAMAERGEATLTFDGGPQATLLTSVGGTDTVTVWVTNDYGTDSTWRVVNIKTCGALDTLPWEDDFSDRFLCWWQPEGSQWQLVDGVRESPSAFVYNWNTVNDNWLVSRAITLPEFPMSDGEVLQLNWDAGCQYQNRLTYSVLVTTGDYRDKDSYDTLAAFTSEVLPNFLRDWSNRYVDLTAYAGQTIHIAFRYNSNEYQPPHMGTPGWLVIDNVRIRDTRAPKVSIVQPEQCLVGDIAVCRTQYIHGEQSSMSYTWYSSLLDSTFYADSNPLVYPLPGVDTLTLVATNAYGSDTVSATITVEAQPLPLLDLSIPSMVKVQTEASFSASVSECSPLGLAVTWHSAMLDTTFIQRDTFSSEWVIMYDHVGIDTVTIISSNIYGADTVMKEINVYGCDSIDCADEMNLPYFEHFECVTAMWAMVEGYLPGCWNYNWNDSSAAKAAHVIPSGGFLFRNLPSQALLMNAGTCCSLSDTVDVLLPRFANSLQTLSVAFDYRFESITRGSLIVGFYNGNTFTALQTMPLYDQTYRRDTVSLASATVQDGRIALRWTYSGSSYYGVVIDNIEVFHNGEMHDLRLSSSDTLMGTVSGGGLYADGDTATIIATPAENYHFVMWNDSIADNPRTVVVAGDTSLTAYFAPDTTPVAPPDTVWHTVSVVAVMADGSPVTELDEPVRGAGTYADGDTVILQGQVNGCGTSLVYWLTAEGDTVYDNPYTFVIHSDVSLTAVFREDGGIDSDLQPPTSDITLHPNPATASATISGLQPGMLLTLLDLNGRQLQEFRIQDSELKIDVSWLPAGTYFLRLSSPSATVVRRLVKR